MNRTPLARRAQIINCLVEGNSIRSTERMTGTHRDTIRRLLVEVGGGCAKLMDEQMRELPCRRIEVDEIWAYVGKKQRHMTPLDDPRRLGDQYTFVALDPETKIVPAYRSIAALRTLQFCAGASDLARHASDGSAGERSAMVARRIGRAHVELEKGRTMSSRAYVVLLYIPGASELYVAVAETEDEASAIIADRPGARAGEDISVVSALDDEAARKIGADLSRPGLYANFVPGHSN